MSEKKRYIANYLTQVSKSLYCTKTLKKKILKDIKNAVLDYAENNSIADEKQLENHFGSPEEIAKSHIADSDPKKIKTVMNFRRILIAVISVLLALFMVFLIGEVIDSFRDSNGQITFVIEEGTTKILSE